MRALFLSFPLLAILVNPTWLQAEEPSRSPDPRTITLDASQGEALMNVVRTMSEQANIPIRVEGETDVSIKTTFRDEPFWSALEKVASLSGHRVTLSDGGSVVNLVASRQRPPVAVDGVFRAELREAITRRDFTSGSISHHLGFAVNWEPRLRVLRLDAYPAVEATLRSSGREIRFSAPDVSRPVSGSMADSLMRLDGYTGAFDDLLLQTATFRATIAEKMIAFSFRDLTKTGVTQTSDGVSVTVKSVQERGGLLLVSLELEYPPDLPTFESFENWLTDNRIAFVSPDGKRERSTSDFQLAERGRVVRASYAFEGLTLAELKGWSLRYQTPSPPREVTLRFQFADG